MLFMFSHIVKFQLQLMFLEKMNYSGNIRHLKSQLNFTTKTRIKFSQSFFYAVFKNF